MDRNISTVKKHISPGQITQNELESILNLTETYVTFCIGDMKGQHITVHCLYEHGFRRIIDLQSSSEKLSGQRKQRIWSELEDYTFHGSGAIPIKYICPKTNKEGAYISLIDDELYKRIMIPDYPTFPRIR